jgi:transcriptional regulator with XRE-family HTH domain
MTVQTGERIFPNWTFADRIRKVRSMAGQDQREFAKQLGVTASALAAWETGRAVPRDIVAIAKRIEMRMQVPAQWTLGLDDGPPDNGFDAPHPHNGVQPPAPEQDQRTEDYQFLGSAA